MASPKVGSPTTSCPVLEGDLAGEEGAAPCVAVVEDFEQVVASLSRE